MVPEKKKTPASEGPSKPCPECQGRGWVDKRCLTPDQSDLCTFCNGKGFDAGGKECYACHGTGRIETRSVDKNVCPTCRGAGVHPVPASMTINEYAYRPGRK